MNPKKQAPSCAADTSKTNMTLKELRLAVVALRVLPTTQHCNLTLGDSDDERLTSRRKVLIATAKVRQCSRRHPALGPGLECVGDTVVLLFTIPTA